MFGAVILAVVIAYSGNFDKPFAKWKKYLVLISITIALLYTILPNIAGNWANTYFVKNEILKSVKVLVSPIPESLQQTSAGDWIVEIKLPKENEKLIILNETDLNLLKSIKDGDKIAIDAGFDTDKQMATYISTIQVNPLFTYPFIPDLTDRVKILNLHVPMSWIAVVAYLVSMIYSVKYLRKKELDYDIKAAASSSLGTLFAILATVTGMLWAKFNWGSYWSWDPRQTSILILILIYAAYFVLRSSIENEEPRARLSSVYSIIAFVTVPFLVFILPRITTGLHPGAGGEEGPILSNQPSALDSNLMYSFGISLFGFCLLYFWMMNLKIRLEKINYKLIK